MGKIPLYLYVAQNNPSGAANIISKFNMGQPQTIDDLARGLKHIMATKGEKGFIEIAKQHPDRKLILDVEALTNETKSNCGGCSAASGSCSNFSSVDGPTPTIDKENIRFATKEDLDKYEIDKKLNEIEKKLTKDEISSEVKKILKQSNNFITNNLPTLAIIAVGAFLYLQIKK